MADLISMLAAAAGAGGVTPSGYQISRSLRFNSADSAYLSRTPAGAGNRRTWTWSGWVKPSKIASYKVLFSAAVAPANTDSTILILYLDQSNSTLGLSYATVGVSTSALLRDPAAWYHIVCAVDTTQATEANRIKIYINGVEASFSSATYPSQNTDGAINNNIAHAIGRRAYYDDRYLDGYLTEIHFVDGQALTPSSFGETDAITGVWKPKAYAGTYGTNGFHLDFSDNTSTTTLGYDAAGSNDWTTNNFLVAAGADNDSLVDTPTPYGTDTGAGGEVRGNYCTLNPLEQASTQTLSNGNLQSDINTSRPVFSSAKSIFGITSGKWYWEFVKTTTGTANVNVGVWATDNLSVGLTSDLPANNASLNNIGAFGPASNNSIRVLGLNNNTTQDSYTNGNVIGIAFDADAGKLYCFNNGSELTGQDIDAGTSLLPTMATGKTYLPFLYMGNGGAGTELATVTLNLGQRPFAYTAPSGFKALCTQNLAEGTITTSGTFTGNGNTNGPFVYLNGVPTAMTIDGNAVTFGTHADKLANGFKVRSSSASYNANATSMSYTISTTGAKFKYANAQPNP